MTAPEDILHGGATTYSNKNDDYGDSWRKVGEILELLADGETVELKTPEDHISYGLYTRRLDKLARSYHGEFFGDNPNYEPTIDAHEDEMVYASMHASLLHEDEDSPKSLSNGLRRRNRRARCENREANSGKSEDIGAPPGVSTEAGEVSEHPWEPRPRDNPRRGPGPGRDGPDA